MDEVAPLTAPPSGECLGGAGEKVEETSLWTQPLCLRPVVYSAPGLGTPLQEEASTMGEAAPTQKRIHKKVLLRRERISTTKSQPVLIAASDLASIWKPSPAPSLREGKASLDREEPQSTLAGKGCVRHSLLGQEALRGLRAVAGRTVVVRKSSSPQKAQGLKPNIRAPATGWDVSPLPSHRIL